MEVEKRHRQFLVAIIVNLSTMAAGTALGWTAPVLPKLSDPDLKDTPLSHVLSDSEASWIGSLLSLGAIFGPLIGGPMANIVGRKYTLLGTSSFFIIASILLLTTTSVAQICVARFLQGMGMGSTMCVQPMYLGEISSKEVRGALGSFIQLFLVTGGLYVAVIGPYVSYYTLQWACLAVPLAFVVAFCFMPESPAYYVQKEKTDRAVLSLTFLRGKSKEGVQDEIIVLQKSVNEGSKYKRSFFDVFRNKASVRALIIVVGLFAFQQLSGTSAVMFYSTTIFMKASSSENDGLDPNISTILLSTVALLSAAVTPMIADRLGRKIILLVSAAGMAVAMFFLGLYFLFDSNEADFLPSIAWLPITSLLAFVVLYAIGFGTIPFAVHSEIFAPEFKSQASTIVAMTCQIIGFLVAKYFSTMNNTLGTHWSFWIFGTSSGIAFLFVSTLMFETKGLTLREIQDKLNGI